MKIWDSETEDETRPMVNSRRGVTRAAVREGFGHGEYGALLMFHREET